MNDDRRVSDDMDEASRRDNARRYLIQYVSVVIAAASVLVCIGALEPDLGWWGSIVAGLAIGVPSGAATSDLGIRQEDR